LNAIVQFRAVADAPADGGIVRALLQACSACVAVAEGGRFVYASEAFGEALGFFHREEIEGHAVEQHFLDIRAKLEHSCPVFAASTEAVCRDGSRLPVRIDAAGVRVGARDLLVVTLRRTPQDEGDAQRLQERDRLEALGRLVGGVTHDFNNLLTGILLYCDLLLVALNQQGPLAGYVREIRQAGAQSADLIAQLLAFARREAPSTAAVSWQEVVGGMRNLLGRLIGENIELASEFALDTGTVGMDAASMRQIVLNLVLNARDAMPEGGRITLVTRNGSINPPAGRHQDAVEFVVADSGCGMKATTRARMFEPFFTTKPSGRGNGLGLATVRRLVEGRGGTVAVRSRAGRGTQVSICLPRADQGHATRSQESQR